MPNPLFSLGAGSIVNVTVCQDLEAQTLFTGIHYKLRGSVTVGDGWNEMKLLYDWVDSAAGWLPYLSQCQTNQVGYTYIQAQAIYPQRWLFRRKVDMTNTAGAVSSPAVSANIAAVITRKTAVATRHGTGTIHIGGVPTNAMIAGKLTVAYQTGPLKDLALKLAETIPIESHFWDPVLLDRVTMAASEVVVDSFPQETIRTMRRRGLRLGI